MRKLAISLVALLCGCTQFIGGAGTPAAPYKAFAQDAPGVSQLAELRLYQQDQNLNDRDRCFVSIDGQDIPAAVRVIKVPAGVHQIVVGQTYHDEHVGPLSTPQTRKFTKETSFTFEAGAAYHVVVREQSEGTGFTSHAAGISVDVNPDGFRDPLRHALDK